MSTRIITADEAASIAATDPDNLPFRVINALGRARVSDFVKNRSARPDRQNLDAWYAEAEHTANNATPGESIIIEMHGTHTVTGNPATLVLEKSDFDWTIMNRPLANEPTTRPSQQHSPRQRGVDR